MLRRPNLLDFIAFLRNEVVELLLMRHGAVEKEWKKSYLGTTDAPLSLEGIRNIVSMAQCIKEMEFDSIISSNLQRCRQTAEIIGELKGLRVEVDSRVREIDMGCWDGKLRKQIKRLYPCAYKRRGNSLWRYRCRGRGESFADVASRASRLVDECFQRQVKVLIVTHLGVIRSLLCHYHHDMPVVDAFKFSVKYGAVISLCRNSAGNIEFQQN